MTEKSLLLNLTGDMPLFKIIDFLLENKGMDFSKKDIAEGAYISRASLFNYWSELEKQGIIKTTRSFGKTKLYTLNSKNIKEKKQKYDNSKDYRAGKDIDIRSNAQGS